MVSQTEPVLRDVTLLPRREQQELLFTMQEQCLMDFPAVTGELLT